MRERMQKLTGKIITTVEGKKHKLEKVVGYGAQGIVYADSTGNKMIKFYYPTSSKIVDEDILERLRFIRNVKMPANFVEIEDIIDAPYVGYVMERVIDHKPLNSYLIPDRKMSLAEWYNQGLGFRERIYLGYIIAKAFKELERKNLSYCDISGNNILVKMAETQPKKREASIKMIDVDNIYIAGKGAATILGTPRYIAPEIISRQRTPDVLSDNYSLAVILFELLRVGHPYISDDIWDGTPEEEEAALAGKCDYVTDDNSTNMLPADVVLTEKLKKLFERCFVDGKKDRLARPSAEDFEFALLEASNKIIRCPSCAAWHYPRKNGREYDGCPWCDAPSKPKARLNFYDILTEGDDYRTGKIINRSSQRKLVNSYILREGKNRIKSLYVLRYDDPSKCVSRAEENYLDINYENGWWANNAYNMDTIIVWKYQSGQYFVRSSKGKITEQCQSGEYISLKGNEAINLMNGDRIYFELNVTIEVGGKPYSFIRMAQFMEEAQ